MKYGAILCDPPWKFEAYSNKGITTRSAESHYSTEAVDSLSDIRVPGADTCAIFMWSVDSHVAQAVDLMALWGFEYKTIAFIWVKTCKTDPTRPRMGMGLWTRKQAEICLMGTRGKPPRRDKGVRQVIMEPRREHSRKPDIYERIERLVDGPYLEMFARQRWPGWDQHGNEIDKFAEPAA